MITLTVPFVYEAIIIKPRCSKPSLVVIKDSVDVEIKTSSSDELPVAFKVGERNIHWDGKRLWNMDFESVSGRDKRKVNISEVIENTESNGETYEFSCPGTAAPFKNFYSNLRWSDLRLGPKHNIKECGFDKWVGDDGVIEKSDVQCREWVEDNRAGVIGRLNNIVEKIMAVDGIMFCTIGEPRYEVISFGAGHNYSVAMFVSYGYNANLSKNCYFNALGFEQAQRSLLERSPGKSTKAEPNGGNRIEVLIPNAVKCNPQLQHVD